MLFQILFDNFDHSNISYTDWNCTVLMLKNLEQMQALYWYWCVYHRSIMQTYCISYPWHIGMLTSSSKKLLRHPGILHGPRALLALQFNHTSCFRFLLRRNDAFKYYCNESALFLVKLVACLVTSIITTSDNLFIVKLKQNIFHSRKCTWQFAL